MTNQTNEELRRAIGDVLAYLKADRISGSEAIRQVWHLSQSHTNKAISDVLDDLEDQSIDAQYYIPNSPDDTYTSGEVIRLSAIQQERNKLKEQL